MPDPSERTEPDDPEADPTAPIRPPETGGGPVGPEARPGDYGATEDEQRRVQGQPDSDRRNPAR